MAVRSGFEPEIRVNVYTLSRRAPSATRTSHLLRKEWVNYSDNILNCKKKAAPLPSGPGSSDGLRLRRRASRAGFGACVGRLFSSVCAAAAATTAIAATATAAITFTFLRLIFAVLPFRDITLLAWHGEGCFSPGKTYWHRDWWQVVLSQWMTILVWQSCRGGIEPVVLRPVRGCQEKPGLFAGYRHLSAFRYFLFVLSGSS